MHYLAQFWNGSLLKVPAVPCELDRVNDIFFIVLFEKTRRTRKRRSVERLIFFGKVASVRICHLRWLNFSRSDRVPWLKWRLEVIHDLEVHRSLGKLILNLIDLRNLFIKRKSIFPRRLYLWLNAQRKILNRIVHVLKNDADLRVSYVHPINILSWKSFAWIPRIIGLLLIAVLDQDLNLRAVIDGAFTSVWCWIDAKMGLI